MKIVFATPSLGAGGREKVMSMLINDFAQRGELEVHLVLYGKKREVVFALHPRVVVHEPAFDAAHMPEWLGILKTLWYVRKKIKDNRFDRVVSFEEKWNRFLLLATIGLRLNIYLSNRNHPYRQYGRVDRMLAKYLYPKAKVLIAQTQIAKTIYEKRYRLQRCVVIGNPIQPVSIPETTVRENVIVSVGRLMTSKYHDRLIRMFSEIPHDGWQLIIVGGDFADQNNSVKLKELVQSLGLQNQVLLTGYQKDVIPYLLRGKIFAFTSDREGFPNAIGEAMAAGLPVIAYDCLAGPSEMIVDGVNGFLVPVFDDTAFKERLVYLMQHESARHQMGRQAKERIRRFDSSTIINQFYSTIITDH